MMFMDNNLIVIGLSETEWVTNFHYRVVTVQQSRELPHSEIEFLTTG